MKSIENKSVVLSWVYLQPFCSTFFTFFSLFSILFRFYFDFISGATKTRQPSSRVVALFLIRQRLVPGQGEGQGKFDHEVVTWLVE